MSVLERLSSVAGDRSEGSNKAVAREALERPEMLDEVAVGLEWDDRKLVADCAQAATTLAQHQIGTGHYVCAGADGHYRRTRHYVVRGSVDGSHGGWLVVRAF